MTIQPICDATDSFGNSVTLAAGSSNIEPGLTPAKAVVLKWSTFAEAADEAGMSRRYGGIHFARADLDGRALGRAVADAAWAKAQAFFRGTAKPNKYEQPWSKDVQGSRP